MEGRRQSHFRTFSAFQSNKTIPKVHRWKGITHYITQHLLSKYTSFFRDVCKNHFLLLKYYHPFHILDPINTGFACIDMHQFSKSISFYLPQVCLCNSLWSTPKGTQANALLLSLVLFILYYSSEENPTDPHVIWNIQKQYLDALLNHILDIPQSSSFPVNYFLRGIF